MSTETIQTPSWDDDSFITPELVASIHKALDKGLTKGLGKPIEGEMCVEALICHKLELPHSDNPPCVGSEVRKAKIVLNDCEWSSNKARAEGMRKLAVAQLGSNQLDQVEFVNRLKLLSTKRLLPFLIQKHFDKTKNEKLLEYKLKFEQLENLNDSLWEEFYNHSSDYCHYCYYYYYYYNYHGDKLLLLVADVILQVLIDMKSPGVKWL